jgi:hypothetical protein
MPELSTLIDTASVDALARARVIALLDAGEVSDDSA